MGMKIRTITSRFWKLQYGFHQITLSYYTDQLKKLVEGNKVHVLISLPRQLFFALNTLFSFTSHL